MLSRVALRCLRARCACALLCIHHTCMRYMRVCLLLAVYVLRIYVLLLLPALAYIFFLASFFFPLPLYATRMCTIAFLPARSGGTVFVFFALPAAARVLAAACPQPPQPAVSIRQHASACARMRQHTSVYVSIRLQPSQPAPSYS